MNKAALQTTETHDAHYLKEELYDLVQNDAMIFEFLQSGSLDGIWYWDLEDPEQEWMSPRFWENFGYDPAEMRHLASEWQDMIHPDDLEQAAENVRRHMEDPGHPYDQICRYKKKDGSTAWVRCRGLAVRDESGKPVRMLGAHTDVTELKRVEEELAQKNEMLRQLLYIVSHDLKQPIRSIEFFADDLAEQLPDSLPGESRDSLTRIARSSRRLRKLIDDILDLSRLRDSSFSVQNIPGNELASEVLEDLSLTIQKEGAEVRINGKLPQMLVHPALALRALGNLVQNAIKFKKAGERARIEILPLETSDSTGYAVCDRGIGIYPENAEKIFALFRRDVGESVEGTGAGLAIVRAIAEKHGGRAWAEPREGGGSVFYLTFARGELA